MEKDKIKFESTEKYLKNNTDKILELFEKSRSITFAWIEIAKRNGIEISIKQARTAHANASHKGKSNKYKYQFNYRNRFRESKKKIYGSSDAFINHHIIGFSKEKSLAYASPEILDLWDYIKNDKLGIKPDQILPLSNKKAYFVCKKGHSEYKRISTKFKNLNGTFGGCEICAGKKPNKDYLLVNHPDFQTNYKFQWHYEENLKDGNTPENVYFFGTTAGK